MKKKNKNKNGVWQEFNLNFDEKISREISFLALGKHHGQNKTTSNLTACTLGIPNHFSLFLEANAQGIQIKGYVFNF